MSPHETPGSAPVRERRSPVGGVRRVRRPPRIVSVLRPARHAPPLVRKSMSGGELRPGTRTRAGADRALGVGAAAASGRGIGDRVVWPATGALDAWVMRFVPGQPASTSWRCAAWVC